MSVRPGRDRRAVLHRGPTGRASAPAKDVVVVGGGIAGISAATVLAERGVRVHLLEARGTWGGRARSWDLGDGRSMSRGFHAFFRQYYTLRRLLARADPSLAHLRDIGDYPLQLADGPRDTFRGIPRTPPWSVAAFALRSDSFPLRELARVDVRRALDLLRVDFPGTFRALDGTSAQDVLDALRFPHDARHLALEVFARSFFADPREFSGGELVGMFHAYFMGSAEGLIFDVPCDAYSRTLWDPLVERLRSLGADARTSAAVHGIETLPRRAADGSGSPRDLLVRTADGDLRTDAVVMAADPRSARTLLSSTAAAVPGWQGWLDRVSAQRNAPPFAVLRLWLDRPAAPDSPAFLGTSGFGPLDNVSMVDRFERTAHDWAQRHSGSVVELHAYALDPAAATSAHGSADESADDTARGGRLRDELLRQMHRLHPELADAHILHEQWLVEDDCPLVGTEPWDERPGVGTPDARIVAAGDWLRTREPVALMERAALTGVQAANSLLARWGVRGEDWWTVPMTGVLRRARSRRPRRP
ncbi:FAD-dependent oxidoreductase [Brachybacterium sp. MASK1Z-5]|uniref:FAD-dependent oxidoreductase n=1 Tax=Brachybacterium halotolerans TaxID=2795215 RepID=A0ABS1B888_9MICO|nr:FAD-dependent oxidoreductase [Brachybacterium halotolerans]MBK0330871.1 FAD-dependent oxidoreductase [Brachybacterium halotolerans]